MEFLVEQRKSVTEFDQTTDSRIQFEMEAWINGISSLPRLFVEDKQVRDGFEVITPNHLEKKSNALNV